MPLIERDDSLLIVVDVQTRFYRGRPDVDPAAFDAFLRRVTWLAAVAAALSVPALATEEDAQRNGPTIDSVLQALPGGTPRLPKAIFGLADDAGILAAVEATGRGTMVLAGMETDVCVAHSAIGLLDRGLRVVAATDALFSPGAAQDHGLARLRQAGAALVPAKGVYYDWVRTLDAARAFERDHPDLADPPGFSL